MTHNPDIVALQAQKHQITAILSEHERRAAYPLPEPYESEFWVYFRQKNTESLPNFFHLGIFFYIFFAIFLLVRNYFIIPDQYYSHDYWRCVLNVVNGAICLFLLFYLARTLKNKLWFSYIALILINWLIILTSILIMSLYTPSLKQQFIFISFIFIFGYLVTGVKPIQMLTLGLFSTLAIFIFLFYKQVDFDPILTLRVFIGSNLIGFAITKIMTYKERTSFLKTKLIEVDQHILKDYNIRLSKLCHSDGLTDISNRRSLDETLEQYYSISRYNQIPLAVLFIDIDYFKAYNDFYGHPQGDVVLRTIAQSIQNHMRDLDFVARYGGEEFVVLFPNTSAYEAKQLAQDLIHQIDKLQIKHEKSDIASHVTISIGLMIYQGETHISPNMLLLFADQALYQAKTSGRHQIYEFVLPQVLEK